MNLAAYDAAGMLEIILTSIAKDKETQDNIQTLSGMLDKVIDESSSPITKLDENDIREIAVDEIDDFRFEVFNSEIRRTDEMAAKFDDMIADLRASNEALNRRVEELEGIMIKDLASW